MKRIRNATVRASAQALLAAAWLVVLSPPALAGPPDPAHCTVDHVIIASWDTHGAPAGIAPCSGTGGPGFDVWVRDAQNNPVPGCTVTVQFAGSGTGIHPYLTQNPGVTLDCQMRTLSVLTDASGHAVMVPRFGHYGESPAIPVYANGQFLTNVEARSPDYNDDGTISLSDLSQFAADYLASVEPRRSDFDDCPGTRLGDFLFFGSQYLASQGKPVEQLCP